jgi:hypothetical protein
MVLKYIMNTLDIQGPEVYGEYIRLSGSCSMWWIY